MTLMPRRMRAIARVAPEMPPPTIAIVGFSGVMSSLEQSNLPGNGWVHVIVTKVEGTYSLSRSRNPTYPINNRHCKHVAGRISRALLVKSSYLPLSTYVRYRAAVFPVSETHLVTTALLRCLGGIPLCFVIMHWSL